MQLNPDALRSLELLRQELGRSSSSIPKVAANASAKFNELYNFQVSRTVTWVTPVGNTDTTVFQLPPRALVTGASVIVEVLPVAGASLTSTQFALGTAAGGQQFILNKNFLVAALPAAGTLVGTTLADLGTSLTGTVNGTYFHTAQDVFLRITNAGGAVGVTAGSLTVYVNYTLKPA